MADTPDVTDDDIPEDIANMSLTDEPSDKPDTGDSEKAQVKEPDAKDTQSKSDEAKGTEAKENKPKDKTGGEKPQVDEQKPEEKPAEKPDDPKDIARRAYQERQRTKQQVAQQLDQVYGPKTKEDLVEEGMDEAKAEVEALRQEMAFERQRATIAELNAGLQADAVNVLNDFTEFDPKPDATGKPTNPDYDPEFTQQVQQAYNRAARLQTDENGIVLNAEVGLYDFYKQMHDIYQRGNSRGSEQGQAEALQMLSRTENPGTSSTKPTGDSLEEMEERLGDVVIT